MSLYAGLEPFDSGRLDVGDGNAVYWEACGNPSGKPALVVHGGPGSGCTAGHRRLFDPRRYRIVLFDQRGCGRSTPRATVGTAMAVNTTHHLIADMERLREHLGIDRWLLYGNSWGVTLALAYAEQFPERVTELVLCAVTMTRPADIHWLYHGAGRFFPEAWERFRMGVKAADRDGDLVDAYYRLVRDPDPTVRERAARDWCAWEDAVVATRPDTPPNPRYADPDFRMSFTLIVTHYFRNRAWLEDGQLLRDAGRLSGIPGVMVHGFLDIGGPLVSAWELSRVWPGSELVVVSDAGHLSSDPGMLDAVLAATDRFARRK